MGMHVKRHGEPLRMHRDDESNRSGRYDEYGRRYLLDVTMKFQGPAPEPQQFVAAREMTVRRSL